MSTYAELREDGERERWLEKMRLGCGHTGNCPCVQPDPCETCEGTGLKKDISGKADIDDPCEECWGEGTLY